MQELKFEDLSVEQKIGMVTCIMIDPWNRNPETDEYLYEQIRNHAVGCVWVYHTISGLYLAGICWVRALWAVMVSPVS